MLKYYFCYLFIYLLLAKGLHQKEGAVSSIAVQRWSPLWTVYQFQKIRIRDNENKMKSCMTIIRGVCVCM